jgi:VanZ family protein
MMPNHSTASPLPWRLYLPAFVWLAFTMFLFTLPGSAFPDEPWMKGLPIDKAVHIFLFAVLILLFSFPALQKKVNWNPLTLKLWLPLAAVAYGITVEFIQLHWVSNRGFEWLDVVADTTGTVLGTALGPFVFKPKK